jgi:hypothetical protein
MKFLLTLVIVTMSMSSVYGNTRATKKSCKDFHYCAKTAGIIPGVVPAPPQLVTLISCNKKKKLKIVDPSKMFKNCLPYTIDELKSKRKSKSKK